MGSATELAPTGTTQTDGSTASTKGRPRRGGRATVGGLQDPTSSTPHPTPAGRLRRFLDVAGEQHARIPVVEADHHRAIVQALGSRPRRRQSPPSDAGPRRPRPRGRRGCLRRRRGDRRSPAPPIRRRSPAPSTSRRLGRCRGSCPPRLAPPRTATPWPPPHSQKREPARAGRRSGSLPTATAEALLQSAAGALTALGGADRTGSPNGFPHL